MKEKESVDILMATYNGAPFIKAQIESIIAQTYIDFHLYISDDGSSDNTRDILSAFATKYPSRITLLPVQNRLGVKANFSLLMSYAKAKYIMLADQDDVWKPDKIEKTFYLMKKTETAAPYNTPILIHTDLVVVNQELQEIAPSFWKRANLSSNAHSLNRLLVQPLVTGCTVMINRPLLELAHPIPGNCVMHDAWLALVASSFGQIEALSSATVFYRQHQANTLGAKKFWSWTFFKEAIKKLSQVEQMKFLQAQELLSRYQTVLQQNEIDLIKSYLSLVDASFLKRFYLIFYFRLFRKGILRNITALFANGLYKFKKNNC